MELYQKKLVMQICRKVHSYGTLMVVPVTCINLMIVTSELKKEKWSIRVTSI